MIQGSMEGMSNRPVRRFDYSGNFLCVPSQSGFLAERLQVQKNTLALASALYSMGVKEVTLCEPSQNGYALERPQAHHQ
jgi:hypothetical protein